MSNSHSSQFRTAKKKQINIRPIKENRTDEPQSEEEKSEKKLQIQSEIDQANEELQRIKMKQAETIKESNAEIEAAKANWATTKQKYIDQAKEEGFEQGKHNGFDQYKRLIADANEVVKAARKDYYSTIEQSDEVILDLAIHTAEKILRQQLNEQRERFVPIVQSAIKDVKNKSEVTIYVHPENYNFVVRQKDELKQFDKGKLNISIYASDELNEGSCLIEHPFGQVDASIDTQLQQLREALHEVNMESDA